MKSKNWFKPKGYTHITKKLGIKQAGFVNSYVSNPTTVSKHRFYPLIHRTIVEKKYKEVIFPSGIKKRSHHKIENGKRITTAKFREIFYSTHIDAHIYSYYAQKLLSPLYENFLLADDELNRAVLAYRRIELPDGSRCKCNIDFANEVFEIIKALPGLQTVLAFDISKFFDSIDHKILKQKWCQLLKTSDLPTDHYKVFRSLTDFSYVELDSILKVLGYRHPNQLIQKDIESLIASGEQFRELIKYKGLIKKNPFRHKETRKIVGIPQGTPISAFLANVYMFDYDLEILKFLKPLGATYRRYSDDILVICPSQYESEIEQKVIAEITRFKLVIQASKTQKTWFYDGHLIGGQPVRYLGFEFDGKSKRLRSSSISKYYRNIKRLIKFKAIRAKKMKSKHPERAYIFKKQIYRSYSHLGAIKGHNRKRNYLSYVNLASEIMDASDANKAIKRQVSKSWKIINDEIVRQTRRHRLHNNEHSFNYYLGGQITDEGVQLSFK